MSYTYPRPSARWTRLVFDHEMYVSTSGNNANNGLSSISPKRTIQAAATAMAAILAGDPGSTGVVLLNRGEQFDENVTVPARSGLAIGAYGTGVRPKVRYSLQPDQSFCGFNLYSNSLGTATEDVRFLDLDVAPLDWDGTLGPGDDAPSGIRVAGNHTRALVEGCWCHDSASNVICQNSSDGMANEYRPQDFMLRNSATIDSWIAGTDVHVQNFLTEGTDGILMEHCTTARGGRNGPATIFRHNIYIQAHGGQLNDCTDPIVRDVVTVDATANGCMVRPGGTIELLLSGRNPLGIIHGANMQHATARCFVCIDSRDITPGSLPRGVGCQAGNTNGGTISRMHHFICKDRTDASTFNVQAVTVDEVTEDVRFWEFTVLNWRDAAGGGQYSAVNVQGTPNSVTITSMELQMQTGGSLYTGDSTVISASQGLYLSPSSNPFDGQSYASWKVAHPEDDSPTPAAITYPNASVGITSYLVGLGFGFLDGGPPEDPFEVFADLGAEFGSDRAQNEDRFLATPMIDHICDGMGKTRYSTLFPRAVSAAMESPSVLAVTFSMTVTAGTEPVSLFVNGDEQILSVASVDGAVIRYGLSSPVEEGDELLLWGGDAVAIAAQIDGDATPARSLPFTDLEVVGLEGEPVEGETQDMDEATLLMLMR